VLGRPTATTHAGIERATFKLFVEYGFDETTLAMIVAEVGIGRRTLFRYFASKNDIPWGQFEQTLARFRDLLAAQPRNLPVLDALGRGVVAFNSFDDDALPAHAARMELILRTPTLRAHSSLKCWEWRTICCRVRRRPTRPTLDRLATATPLTGRARLCRQCLRAVAGRRGEGQRELGETARGSPQLDPTGHQPGAVCQHVLRARRLLMAAVQELNMPLTDAYLL
jgi:AcrR family transcriptional regulator